MEKRISGFENYTINEAGEVYSLKRKKFLTQFLCNGYPRVGLVGDDGKRHHCFVHRLVAEAFIDNPDGLPCVNHKDENRQNNNVSNLEWCSYKYNNNYGNHNTKMAETWKGKASPWLEKTVVQYKNGAAVAEYKSIAEASRQTGISASNIGACANAKRNSAGGYKWGFKYA